MTNAAKNRCELAMQGFVVKCSNAQVVDCVKYITKACSIEYNGDIEQKIKEFIATVKKENIEIRKMVCNRLYGDFVLTFLLETKNLPAPLSTDYGTGYPCSYSYVLNMSSPIFSEYGDTFYEKIGDYYHRRG